MQTVSELYREILSGDHWVQTRLSIGDIGRLIDQGGDRITVGGVGILVAATGADGGYDESVLESMGTDLRVFSEDVPAVGCCVAGEITVRMMMPSGSIPRQARLTPYVRLTDGTRHSEWIQKGVFYIDTREEDDSGKIKWLRLHGYDAMLKAEVDYPASSLDWPAADIDVVREIAGFLGLPLDPRTAAIMTKAYPIQYPGGYSCRETLGYIAAMYAGCFIMNDLGELRLVQLNSIPKETRYLVTSGMDRSAITVGGDRILV